MDLSSQNQRLEPRVLCITMWTNCSDSARVPEFRFYIVDKEGLVMILNEEVIIIFMHPTNMAKLHDIASCILPWQLSESAWKFRETEAETSVLMLRPQREISPPYLKPAPELLHQASVISVGSTILGDSVQTRCPGRC